MPAEIRKNQYTDYILDSITQPPKYSIAKASDQHVYGTDAGGIQPGAYISENLTAWFDPKKSVLWKVHKNRHMPEDSCNNTLFDYIDRFKFFIKFMVSNF